MFTWKRHKDIFKGEGIFHLTFVVQERKPILGELQMVEGVAQIIPSALGSAISHDLNALSNRRPYCRLLAKQLMPDHIHVLIWIKEDCGITIKEIARGMRQGWKKLAAAAAPTAEPAAAPATHHPIAVDINRQHVAVDINRQMASAEIYKQPPTTQTHTAQPPTQAQEPPTRPPLFSAPFIRTLSRKGQLDAMIAYIHDNPRRAMLRRLNPDLFRLRREVQAAGRLLLLEATEATMEDPRVVALTEQALQQKAEAKHQDYTQLPHTALRWRMMANNTIVRILADKQ